MMVGTKLARDRTSVFRFIKVMIFETNGERLYRTGTGAGHQGHHGGRIGPAT